MDSLFLVVGCVVVVLMLLWIERVAMERIRSAIPTRIVVIGTRGKTSVTRLIAAGLSSTGRRVLGKTTGSEPRIVMPNGNERAIVRRGNPTPLEQRRVLYQAVRNSCEVVVLEGMSIRPESLRTELGQIIHPHLVVVTNTYEDHMTDMGDPAEAFANAIPSNATVLLPSNFSNEQQARMLKRNVSIHLIDETEALEYLPSLPYMEWPQNLALALAACEKVGVPLAEAMQGMAQVHMDIGQLGAWTLGDEESQTHWIAINGFATNDPHSTMVALKRSQEQWPLDQRATVGLLNLRHDRGDRTAQWMDAFELNYDKFDCLVVCGASPMSVQRHLRRLYRDQVSFVRSQDPQKIMCEANRLSHEGGYLFGFGNIGGIGARIVHFWKEHGEMA